MNVGKCSRQDQKQRFISIVQVAYTNHLQWNWIAFFVLQDFLSIVSWIFSWSYVVHWYSLREETKKINSHFVAREQNGNNIKKIIYWMHIKCQHWRQKDDADDDDQNQCQYFESQIHIVFCFELNMSPFNWLLS